MNFATTSSNKIFHGVNYPAFPYVVMVDDAIIGYAKNRKIGAIMVLERTITDYDVKRIQDRCEQIVQESGSEIFDKAGYVDGEVLTDVIMDFLGLPPLTYDTVSEVVYWWRKEEGLLEPDWESEASWDYDDWRAGQMNDAERDITNEAREADGE